MYFYWCAKSLATVFLKPVRQAHISKCFVSACLRLWCSRPSYSPSSSLLLWAWPKSFVTLANCLPNSVHTYHHSPFIFYTVPLQPHYLPPASTFLPHFLLAQTHNSSKGVWTHPRTHTHTHTLTYEVAVSYYLFISRVLISVFPCKACQVKHIHCYFDA